MIIKKIINKELYVYMNGSLLYKRWLKQDHGIIIQNNAWGSFRACDVFQHINDNNDTSTGTTKHISEIH